MAAALSRALKLPGKKGSELGEYDPLTQADSEDDSEEDDLVLNYPRNGLGRGNCLGAGSSDLRGGSRSGRLVGGEDEAEEEEEEEDEWRERLPSKSRPDRDDMKGAQYWSQRDTASGRDRGGDDGGAAGGAGGAGAVDRGADPDGKRARARGAIRAAFFLVPLVSAMLLVLLCAFLIPCQKGELEKRPQWERALGDAGGVTPPALALWDVDGDSVEDVLLGVTERTNDTQPSMGNNKVYSAVALSAVSGQVLWRVVMRETVAYIQCGLQYEGHPVPLPAGGAALRAYPETAPLLTGQRERASGPVCLLIGKSVLTAVNGTTGKKLWSVPIENIESQAVLLPDLQGDTVPDLLIATLPADGSSDLALVLLSGLTGAKLGRPVPFNVTTQGKLIGPLLHETQPGAFYILLGLGTVEAVSLCDIYTRATGKMPLMQALRHKDATWEKLKKTNSSSLIHIYSGKDAVDFLLPLVSGFCNNHNSLDTVANLNSSRSDWALVYGSNKLSVLRERDAHKQWTYGALSPMHSPPTPGHFNEDRIPDLLVQHSANGTRKVQVIDGASGRVLWAAEFLCPRLVLEASSVSTAGGQSVFLFWAGETIRAPKNTTKTTLAPGVAAEESHIRNLFLLHPLYPTILLQLNSTIDTAVTAAVSYQEQQKDASYISVLSRPTLDSEPFARIIKSRSLRAAIAKGRVVRLGDGGKASGGAVKPGLFEVNKFFRQLSFKQQ